MEKVQAAAQNNGVYLTDTWENLKENPIFRRAMLPRGFRMVWRSPVIRAVILSLVAVAIFHVVDRLGIFNYMFIAISAVILWTMIYSVQHYLCWVEFITMASSGTLADYLNSGLTRTDVTLGLIYPAKVSETVASILIMGYFLLTTDHTQTTIMGLLFFCIAMRVVALFRPPMLFVPDAENYLRKRNPIALFLISFSIFVPLLVWFTIYFSSAYLIHMGAMLAGIRTDPQNIVVAGFILTIFLSRWPNRWFAVWRLKRFYKRQKSLDELFESYVEN